MRIRPRGWAIVPEHDLRNARGRQWFLIVAVQDRFCDSGGEPRKTSEHLVCYDSLGAREGDLIAFGESREACMPFYPEKRVPLDAYNAAILDQLVVEKET